jgi:hypothetical protein
MSNKSSLHGGFISEGTVIHGTLRTQDLLRALSAEFQRVLPFSSHNLVFEAREAADALNAVDPDVLQHWQDVGAVILDDLFNELQAIAAREGMRFGAHEGDGSDFGYWSVEED